MQTQWGNFTFCGDQQVEQQLTSLVRQVGQTVERAVPQDQYRSLLLIGGYGRGEGGVEIRDGRACPHNNLDFLLVTRGLDDQGRQRLCRAVDESLEPLRNEHGIGIDFSASAESRLARSPSLVMWYDMRHGHKTVLGDPRFAPSLTRFRADRIPAWNMRDMLVNRGTLLVVNEWLYRNAQQSSWDDSRILRTALRHLVKAVIGYGDAVLCFSGQYHWSYAEKQRRMQSLKTVSDRFRTLYDEAIEFRFRPDYEAAEGRDIRQWQADVTPRLAEVHLHCEEVRLSCRLDGWQHYPRAAAQAELWRDPVSPRGWASKAVNLLRAGAPRPQGSGGLACLGLRAAGPQGRLSLAFPAVAYHVPSLTGWAAEVLQCEAPTESPTGAALQDAYLAAWGRHADSNFHSLVRSAGLDLGLDGGRDGGLDRGLDRGLDSGRHEEDQP